jgi:hypothetical protein
MSSAIFYVDESGDPGWIFNAPYRKGGSSRYMTIGALICPSEKKHLPKRLIRNLYNQFAWSYGTEKKWTQMTMPEKERFAQEANNLASNHPDIKLFAMTVAKENVTGHMRKDGNKLYNYMVKLLLANEMCQYDNVTLVPDAKSIKVASGNSLHDYLWIHLTYERGVETDLKTFPCDSSCTPNVQFADMLSGLVHHYYEDSYTNCWNIINNKITSRTLFF